MRIIGKERAMVRACRRLVKDGLVTATDGNLSVRMADSILITPTSLRKERVEEKDLVYLGFDGEVLEGGVPSKEYLFHLSIYQSRQDINAICHAHPTIATALAHRLDATQNLLYDAEMRFSHIAYLGDFEPGSNELASAVGEAARHHEAIILNRHGVITYGKGIDEAVDEMAALERWARTFVIQQLLKG